MTDKTENVEQHYHSVQILQAILDGLTTNGKDINKLKPQDLAAVDAFHIRGREATIELAEKAGFQSGQKVLDVGCALGGSARFIAEKFGCTVHGIDLTHAYIETATDLSERAGFTDQVFFQQANALQLPFAPASFDFIWTEHVQMNIEDKETLYAEMARVLKPSGSLLFHDVFQGENPQLHYPVPWAESSEISHLITPEQAQQFLSNCGFKINAWQDKTEQSLQWLLNGNKAKKAQKSAIGLHLLMGENIAEKIGNIANNIQQGNIVIAQCIAQKA